MDRFLKAAAATAALMAAPLTAAAQETFTDAEKAAIHSEIETYLLANPEIVLEALRALEEKRAAEQDAARRRLLSERSDEIFNDAFSFVAGNPDGDVTLVEFTDYNCPYCRRAQPQIQAFLVADPNVRHVVKVLSFIGDEIAERAAIAALSADRSKFAAFHTGMMSHDGRLDPPTIERLAADAGYDVEALRAGMGAAEVSSRIEETRELARALGVEGTPAFVMGDEVMGGVQPHQRLTDMAAAVRAQ